MSSYASELTKLRFPRDINTSPVSIMYLFNPAALDFEPLSGTALPNGSIALNTNIVGGLLQVENLAVTSTPTTIKTTTGVTTTDNYSAALIVATDLVLNKTLSIKNTGVNDADIQVMGSLDGSVFDILITSAAKLNPGQLFIHYSDTYMVSVSIQVKNNSSGAPTTLDIKYAGISQ